MVRSVSHREPTNPENERLSQADTVIKHMPCEQKLNEKEPSASTWRPDRVSDI